MDEEVAGAVPSVQEKFEKALAEAKTVSETVAVTQQQINDAWGELLDAIHYLDFQAGDKTELKIQLDIAAQIIEASEGLDPSSIEELKAVMEEAQKVYDNRDAMEPEITEAVENLKEAIDNVRHQADKSTLTTVIAKAESIDLSEYIEEGQDTFTAALESAKEIYDDPSATQKRWTQQPML